MKILMFILRSSWAVLAGAILAGVLSGLGGVLMIGVVKQALGAEQPQEDLTAAFFGLLVVVPLARLLSQYLLTRLGQEAVFKLRLQISRWVLDTPLRNLEEIGSARLLATLTSDVAAITQAIRLLPTICVNVSVVLGCLVYMGALSLPLLGLVLLVLSLGSLAYVVAFRAGIRRFHQAREEQDEMFGHFRALSRGTKELKLHEKRATSFLESIEDTGGLLVKLNVTASMMFRLAANWGWMLFFVVLGVLLFVLPWMQEVGTDTLVGFTLILLFMRTPMESLFNSAQSFGRGNVAVEKIRRLGLKLSEQQEDGPENGSVTISPESWQQIELRGVTHTYRSEKEDREFTLGPIDLTVQRGEILFVVGGNGSGKTTLAKLLTGLYVPDAGEIRVDGEPVGEHNRGHYRSLFSVIFSDFYLFDRLLGLDGADLDERAEFYLESLQIETLVNVHEGRLSTTSVSQGQQKRLALLTAYLENREIYLFDEWAADQDPDFKALFYHRLLPELRARGKTVVAISHDDRYYSSADRLVKLEDGKLSEHLVEMPFGVAAAELQERSDRVG